MFISDTLYSIVKENPFDLSIACLFSIIERVIKTVFIIQTIDTMLLSKSSLSSTDILYALQCTCLLSIRYLFAANRHVFAYKSGLIVRNTIIQYYHREWLTNPVFHIKEYNYTVLLNNIGDKIKELISRIAIDLIPGIISIFVGCYTLIRILEYPIGIYCIVYICGIEYLYYNVSRNYSARKDKLEITETMMSAKVFFIATDSIEHRETVHIYDRLKHELTRFKNATRCLFDKEIELKKLQNYQDSFLHWMLHLINGGILWMTRGHLTINSSLILLLYNVNEIRHGIHEIRTFCRYQKITVELLNTLKNTVNNNTDIEDHIRNSDRIELHNVDFAFECKSIFKNMSISFESGSTTALLGVNGAGKTTLFKILLREYKINKGDIRIPSKRNILLCEQKPQLFLHESVAYNIAYGCSEILDKSIELKNENGIDYFSRYSISVQKAVEMLEIEYMENYSTQVLSDGEKQKVSIARVLAKAIESPESIKLLLLDEWDSALDYKSRKITYKAIQYIQMMTGCITIFITHNISDDYLEFYKDCNAIILDDGHIIDNGPFRAIWDRYTKL